MNQQDKEFYQRLLADRVEDPDGCEDEWVWEGKQAEADGNHKWVEYCREGLAEFRELRAAGLNCMNFYRAAHPEIFAPDTEELAA